MYGPSQASVVGSRMEDPVEEYRHQVAQHGQNVAVLVFELCGGFESSNM